MESAPTSSLSGKETTPCTIDDERIDLRQLSVSVRRRAGRAATVVTQLVTQGSAPCQ
jgi:hypothetical protein